MSYDKCLSFKFLFKPRESRVDFELSAHTVIKFVYPECAIFGCKFHFNLGYFQSKKEYKVDPKTEKWLKTFFGLSLLSYTEVSDAFR